jgi:hypothetical protein
MPRAILIYWYWRYAATGGHTKGYARKQTLRILRAMDREWLRYKGNPNGRSR